LKIGYGSIAVDQYHLFETAHGFAAIAWNTRGISSFRLPAPSAEETRRSLLRRLPGAVEGDPSPAIARVIEDAKRYFAGEAIDFSGIEIDLGDQDPLFARIYALVRTFGWGETTSYGAIAKALGEGPQVARDVGQAMASNPVPLIVPCHRVLAAGGKIGGFSAPGGSNAKARMLELEGVQPEPVKAAPPPIKQASFGF
jgi:methylated-DNA-[protein]-cysteine S-methyltransferase